MERLCIGFGILFQILITEEWTFAYRRRKHIKKFFLKARRSMGWALRFFRYYWYLVTYKKIIFILERFFSLIRNSSFFWSFVRSKLWFSFNNQLYDTVTLGYLTCWADKQTRIFEPMWKQRCLSYLRIRQRWGTISPEFIRISHVVLIGKIVSSGENLKTSIPLVLYL